MSVEVTSRAKILEGWLDLKTAAIEMNLGREIRKVIFNYAFAKKRSTKICMAAPAKNIFSSFKTKLKNIADILVKIRPELLQFHSRILASALQTIISIYD